MKNSLIFIYLLCFTASAIQAQVVNIPDTRFKAKLISLGVDANGDNSIQNSEAALVTSLDVSASIISNMTGIEAFVNLQALNCSSNSIANLVISNNTNLTHLNTESNLITSLDVSNNVLLTHLSCCCNQLTNLDVSNNLNLKALSCGSNPLTSLDISINLALDSLVCTNNQLTSLDVSNNLDLKHLWCDNNQFTSLDVTNNLKLQYLSCQLNFLTNLDVSINLDLKDLSCGSNPLAFIDVSHNLELGSLVCMDNLFTNLDVSHNTNLATLSCGENQLTDLDLSKNTKLTYFFCSHNQLTSLDLSNNPDLVYVFCYNNQLSSLDLSYAKQLNWLYCYANQLEYIIIKNNSIEWRGVEFYNNPTLNYVCVDSAQVNSIQTLVQYYGMTNVTVDTLCTPITRPTVYIPDANFKAKLIAVGVDANQDSNIQYSEAQAITLLDVSAKNIYNMIGLEAFINLKVLNCAGNTLINLDISNNTLLESLDCCNNQLASLSISNNTLLGYLNCSNNQLTSLDASHNSYLLNFNCSNNQLNCLLVKNSAMDMTQAKINFEGNPTLTYICADSAEIQMFQTKLESLGMTNVTVESICAPNCEKTPIEPLSFRFYPNPVYNTLTIETPSLRYISLLNLMGEVVSYTSVNGKEVLDVSHLPQGIYFLKVKGEEKGHIFVKE